LNAAAGFTKIDLSSFDIKKSNPFTVKSNPFTVKSNPSTVKPSMTSPGCQKQQTMTDFFVSKLLTDEAVKLSPDKQSASGLNSGEEKDPLPREAQAVRVKQLIRLIRPQILTVNK
jgi:hypothetical protein